MRNKEPFHPKRVGKTLNRKRAVMNSEIQVRKSNILAAMYTELIQGHGKQEDRFSGDDSCG